MKNSGRSLKYRLQMLGDRLARIKYRKGHGVHSPFVYGLVRKVFMVNELFEGSGTALYDALIAVGASEKRAKQLHNTMVYCEAESFSIDCIEGDFVVVTPNYPTTRLNELYEAAKSHKATLVIAHPYLNRERQNEVRRLRELHTSTTVDNRAYIIFFNNHLPKQHYRL